MMRKLNKRQANFVMTEVTGIILALAVAFFFVAMPADVFGQLVSASGLPAILPAAAPPLGETTRMIVGALAGSIAGMGVILLFLFLDPQPEKQQPDILRPFSAQADLPPIETAPVAEAKPLGRPSVAEEPITVPFEIVEEPAVPQPREASEPIFLDFRAIRAAARPVTDPAKATDDQPPLDLSRWKMVEPEAAPEPPPRPISSPDRRFQEESIYALMARLEAGLEKRAEAGAAPSKAPEINRSGVGLRSTLDELRKMAVKR